MHHVDLVMVDLSDDAWFDLDLNNYQNQLVNGYTRMTPEAGVQIFMPDLDNLPKNKGTQNISLEWLKHRNLPPPAGYHCEVELACMHRARKGRTGCRTGSHSIRNPLCFRRRRHFEIERFLFWPSIKV